MDENPWITSGNVFGEPHRPARRRMEEDETEYVRPTVITKRVAVEVDRSENLRADLYKTAQERNQLSAQTYQMMQIDDLTRELREKLATQQTVIDQQKENERVFMANVQRQWEEREAAERQNREQLMSQMKEGFRVELERRTDDFQAKLVAVHAQKENECAILEQRMARNTQTRSQPANGGATTTTIRAIKKKYGNVSSNTTLFIQPQSTSSARDQPPVSTQAPGISADSELSEADQRMVRLIGVALRQVMGKGGEILSVNETNGPSRCSRKKKINKELVVEDRKVNRADRTSYLGLVRWVFKDSFDVEEDADFAYHDCPDIGTARLYDEGGEFGPDPDQLKLDLRNGPGSRWNKAVFKILLAKLRTSEVEDDWELPKVADIYLENLIQQKYNRARIEWKRAQTKKTHMDVAETPDEVEVRMNEYRIGHQKRARDCRRRRAVGGQCLTDDNITEVILDVDQKFERRLLTVSKMIAIKTDVEAADLQAWEWLKSLLNCLSYDGMSSEESCVDGAIEKVFRVKLMTWRRNIDHELDIIDTVRIKDRGLYSDRGSKPGKRLRGTTNLSKREPCCGLPRELYDDDWFDEMKTKRPAYVEETLCVSEEQFEWLNIAAQNPMDMDI